MLRVFRAASRNRGGIAVRFKMLVLAILALGVLSLAVAGIEGGESLA